VALSASSTTRVAKFRGLTSEPSGRAKTRSSSLDSDPRTSRSRCCPLRCCSKIVSARVFLDATPACRFRRHRHMGKGTYNIDWHSVMEVHVFFYFLLRYEILLRCLRHANAQERCTCACVIRSAEHVEIREAANEIAATTTFVGSARFHTLDLGSYVTGGPKVRAPATCSPRFGSRNVALSGSRAASRERR
jgi:hypothetical protein